MTFFNYQIANFILHYPCNKDIQEKRILKRNRDNIEWELQRFVDLHEIQKKASLNGFIGKEIDSSYSTIEEISNKIMEDINLTTASTSYDETSVNIKNKDRDGRS